MLVMCAMSAPQRCLLRYTVSKQITLLRHMLVQAAITNLHSADHRLWVHLISVYVISWFVYKVWPLAEGA